MSVQLRIADSLYQKADDIYEEYPDSSLFLFDKTTNLYKELKDWDKYIRGLNILAVIHYGNEERTEYLYYTKKAIEISEKHLKPNHPEYAAALSNLTFYYRNLGDYKTAISLLKKTIEIELESNVDKESRAVTYDNLGDLLSRNGDYEEALTYLNKGLDLLKDTFTVNPIPYLEHQLAMSQLAIGWTYLKDDQLEKALDFYDQGLFALKKLKTLKNYDETHVENDIINALQSSAKIYLLLGETMIATLKIREALSLQKEKKAFLNAYSYEILGDINQKEREYVAAIENYERAVSLAESRRIERNRPLHARLQTRLAQAKTKTGKYLEALSHYQKALQILSPSFHSDKFQDNPLPSDLYSKLDALEILSGKGNLLEILYKKRKEASYLTSASHTYKSGIEVINDIRESVVTKSAKNTLSEKTVAIYEGAIQTTLEKYEINKNEKLLLEGLAFAESNKSLLLLESFNEQAALGLKGLPDSLLQKDKELRLQIAFYQKKIVENQNEEGINDTKLKAFEKELFDYKAELQNLTDHFEKNYPSFYQLKYQPQTTTPSDWQQFLVHEQQGLIEYFVGEEIIYVFVLWGEGCKVFEIENKNPVFQSIQILKNSISLLPTDDQVLQNYQDFTTSAYDLYQSLLAPALQALPKDIRALKIIPDDQLNHIPFDLLLMEKAPAKEVYFSAAHLNYLLNKYQVSYDYSATWMVKNQSNYNNNYTKEFIAYAPSFKKATEGVSFRSCTAGDLYNLECSKAEVEAINALLNGDLRIGGDAAKSIFEKEVHNYRIIHMATHACADEANPLFNKIFLTDDYLSNADLYNTSLNAELVVLSACNTGSGKLIKGEGVLSLARGFVQAGCASSIVSRWSVDDCATSEIMQLLYKELKSGARKDEALRRAKLGYLEGADRLGSHPYYWGAFVGYGDMGEMVFWSRNRWWILGGVGVVGVLLFFWFYRRF